MDYIKTDPDRKGRISIVEGTKEPDMVFKVNRFICDVVPQQTQKETQELADFILEKLEK